MMNFSDFRKQWPTLLGAVVLIVGLAIGYINLRSKEQNEKITDVTNWITRLAESRNIIDSKIANLTSEVRTLTTDEIVDRLKDMERSVHHLNLQVQSLQQIISPKNANEILTVAKMKDEILARGEFEKRTDDKLNRFENRLGRVDEKVDMVQYWIWGILGSLVVGLVGVSMWLARRIAALGKLLEDKN